MAKNSLTGFLLAMALSPACTTTDTSTCATDAFGNYICTDYVAAYPYDYAYVDPLYVDAGGYYPYTVDTYYDPLGYDYYLYSLVHVQADTAAAGTDVSDLLDKAHRAANAINYGVRVALDPIKELIKTSPTQKDAVLTFGPADHAEGNYKFTMRQLVRTDKRYAWKLEARPKGDAGDFSLVAAGTIKVGDTDRRGTGVLGIDCGKLHDADSSVTCRGEILMGFTQPDGDKILNITLKDYTFDPDMAEAMNAKVFAWRLDDNANHVRLVTRANVTGTGAALENVTIKLSWMKDVGARADAAANGGDIPSGQTLFLNSCVGPSLSSADTMTTTRTCTSTTECTVTSGQAGSALSCPSGLGSADEPSTDPTASDPPDGAPEMPTVPTSMPDGNG